MSTPLKIGNKVILENGELLRVPNIKQAFGNIGYSWDAGNRFDLISRFTCEQLTDGTYIVKGSGIVSLSIGNTTDISDYGLRYGKIRDLLGVGFTKIIGYPIARFYRPNNSIYHYMQSLNNYGGTLEVAETGRMRPARFYTEKGDVGGWKIDKWENGDLIEFEFYAK